MSMIFCGKYVSLGAEDIDKISHLLILANPDGVCEEVVLNERQQRTLNVIAEIGGIDTILGIFAGAGFRLGYRLGKKAVKKV